MTNLTFITDETHGRRYVQLDLAELANVDVEKLEDLIDVIIAEARKDEPLISLKEFEEEEKKNSGN